MSGSRVKLAEFSQYNDYDRGCSPLKEIAWYLLKMIFFISAFPWPSPFKCVLLRVFGAKVGKGVYIKPRVNIHFPWKLEIGDDCWIGEESWLLNFEPIVIGANCCVSQRVFLCSGNHDFRKPHLPYRNAPIRLEDGVWIGAQTFVSPGVVVGTDTVVAANSTVLTSLPENAVCRGNPCVVTGKRWKNL